LVDPTIKLFPADKNYILKEAQVSLKDVLIEKTAFRVLHAYRSHYNPLGIVDEFILTLENYTFESNPVLEGLYFDLAVYYRFQNADNQLELLFDGDSHFKKYSKDWEEAYLQWIDELCSNYYFIKTLIGATVFYPGPQAEVLLHSRIGAFLNKHFKLKIYKHRGIHEMSVA